MQEKQPHFSHTPDCNIRPCAFQPLGVPTRSYTCVDLSGFVEERYELLVEGLIRVRLLYKTYVPADTPWLRLSEEARDKMRPGRAIFRQVIGTLAPIEPAAKTPKAAPAPAAADPPPKQVAPLLR